MNSGSYPVLTYWNQNLLSLPTKAGYWATLVWGLEPPKRCREVNNNRRIRPGLFPFTKATLLTRATLSNPPLFRLSSCTCFFVPAWFCIQPLGMVLHLFC
jgi:hypothetical protein